MIETLRIADLAVVEQAEIEFGPGLNVLTGETGAGKSLVLGALALLAGGRAWSDAVRDGSSEARVEAVFRTEGLPELEAELRARDLADEDGVLVVSRIVSRGGRSRAQVAGRLVPVSTLAELFAGRLEISSQHESQALRRPERHGRLLDAFGGLLERRHALEAAYEELRAVRAERARLAAEAEERARRADFVAFQLREIEEAELEPGEFATREAEHARLAHAERLRAEAMAAASSLTGDPTLGDAAAAADLAGQAARRLEEVASLDPRLGELAERIRNAQAELADVGADLERYGAGVEVDPGRLAQVEERLQLLERLRRKYGGTEQAIGQTREALSAEQASLTGSDERLRELEEREAPLREALEREALALSRGRARAARRLASQVQAALAALDMPRARLEVALDAAPAPEGMPCGPGGAESPELRFAANPGDAPRPLQRVASGGELSRVFLALKNVLRRSDAGMVLVFDEVDAGVSGRAADRVGRVLGELAAEHQVLCITHLPQIAARGETHLRVAKAVRDRRAHAEVRPLGEKERVEEIARMAGGEAITDATRRHARELLRGRRRVRGARTPPPPPR